MEKSEMHRCKSCRMWVKPLATKVFDGNCIWCGRLPNSKGLLKLTLRYRKWVRKHLPTLCLPIFPTLVSLALISILADFGTLWPALPVGVLLLALLPQWDSYSFRLSDIAGSAALVGVGVSGLL